MLLEEAIKHCEEKALCGDACGLEHKQLANWLRELMQLRYNLAKADGACGSLLNDKQESVIADLEESHKKEVGQLLMEIVELKKEKEYVIEHTADVINGQEREFRHQKYKRCLNNAWFCQKLSKECALAAYTHRGWTIERHFDKKAELYRKWHKRWLAIAEKFKEEK